MNFRIILRLFWALLILGRTSFAQTVDQQKPIHPAVERPRRTADTTVVAQQQSQKTEPSKPTMGPPSAVSLETFNLKARIQASRLKKCDGLQITAIIPDHLIYDDSIIIIGCGFGGSAGMLLDIGWDTQLCVDHWSDTIIQARYRPAHSQTPLSSMPQGSTNLCIVTTKMSASAPVPVTINSITPLNVHLVIQHNTSSTYTENLIIWDKIEEGTIDRYVIERRTLDQSQPLFEEIGTMPNPTSWTKITFRDDNAGGQYYIYRVRAYAGQRPSLYSNYIVASLSRTGHSYRECDY